MRNHWIALALIALGSCAVVPPIPDEFYAAFPTGQICVPSQIGSPTAETKYPIEFRFCLYRCVDLDPSVPVRLTTAFSCSGAPGVPCNMVMLATAHVLKNPNETGCDATHLANPPPGECRSETVQFMANVPTNTSGSVVEGDFVVTIPYLELEQGERVVDRLNAGDDRTTVIQEEIGVQDYPGRKFTLNVSASHPVVADFSAIAATDCRSITAP